MRRAVAIAVAVSVLAGAALPAAARDSDAPPGASHRWLPCEDWVMYHWLPYDERSLLRALRMDRGDLRRWLRNDRVHTIAELVRRRGLDPDQLAADLVDAWVPDPDSDWAAELRSRALRTLTQGHLAQHLFFHRFHHPGIALQSRSIFGVRSLEYRRLRLTGRAPAEIARSRGRSRRVAARRTMSTLRRFGRLGVNLGATPRPQAARFLRDQRRGLSWWLDARIRKPGARRTAPIYRRRTLTPRRRLLCFLFAGRADEQSQSTGRAAGTGAGG